VDAAAFAGALSAELSSPYFGTVGEKPLIRRALALYWWVVRALIG
jgi:hypothetical protein